MKLTLNLLNALQDSWFSACINGEKRSFGAYLCDELKINNPQLKQTKSFEEAFDLVMIYL